MRLIILVLVLGGLAILLFKLADMLRNDWEEVFRVGGVLLATCSIVGLLVIPLMPFKTISNLNSLTVFYDTNVAIYEEVVDLTAVGIDSSDANENLAQIIAYQEALASQRDAIVQYNQKLKNQLYWQDNFLVDILWKNVPDHIKYLK